MADLLQTEEMMRSLGEAITDVFPGMGFVVLAFEFNEPGISNYISNANKDDIVKTLRETADKLESGAMIGKTEGGMQ